MAAVVTFGEAMLRFSPPGRRRLEQAAALEVWPAGAELNAAVGLARLGTSVAWVSRLPRNALGRCVEMHARAHGVDTSRVRWSDDARLGLYFLELADAPRTSAALYDRKGSAFATLEPGELDWPALLAGARAFHVSGITPALSDACAQATADALAAARAVGCHTSYDLNFRARLASAEHSRALLEDVLDSVDTVLASAGDAAALFDVRGDGAAERLRDLLGVETVVLSRRIARNGRQRRLSVLAGVTSESAVSPEYTIVDPLGGGDAFCAGFLHGLLEDGPRRGLEIGVAIAALKHSIPGDAAIVEPAEVERLVAGETARLSR